MKPISALDSMSGPGLEQPQAKLADDGKFTHYRRSKTNKAPRKRTFIANMSKYTEGMIEGLESAARGVGTDAAGHKLPGGLALTGDLLPAGAAAYAAAQGGAAGSYLSHSTSSSAFAGALSVPSLDSLPWDLASLPTVGEPVVWGHKEVPTAMPTHTQQQQQQWGYTELLMGSAAAPTTMRIAHGAAAQQVQMMHQPNSISANNNDAMVAAAVEAALAVIAANSGSDDAAAPAAYRQQLASAMSAGTLTAGAPELPLGGQRAMSWQAAPAAPVHEEPKVSFDLFPELAALAGMGGAAAGAGSGAVSTAAPVAVGGPMCYSRAVVTGMPSQMQVHDAGAAFGAAAAPAPQQQQQVQQQQVRTVAQQNAAMAASTVGASAAATAAAAAAAATPAFVGLDLRAHSPVGAPASVASLHPHMAASNMATAAASAATLSLSRETSQVSLMVPSFAAAKHQQLQLAGVSEPQQQLHMIMGGSSSSATHMSAGTASYPSRSSASGSVLPSPAGTAQLAGSGASGAMYHSSSSSSNSMSSAMSTMQANPALAALLLQSGVPQQQLSSMLSDAAAGRMGPAAMAAAAAAAGMLANAAKSGHRHSSPGGHQPAALMLPNQQQQAQRESPKHGAGRGTKRGRALGSSSSGALAPGAVAEAAAAMEAAAAAGNAASVTGPAAPAAAGSPGAALPAMPFTIPLHGMSAAGAVVPGGAGQLKVTSMVSVGAYGMVYRGRWAESEVAVKMMRTPRAGEPLTASDVLRSFRHETSLLQRLAHPNIVAVRHAQDVEPVCIVQDFASHGTLSEYVHANVSGAAAAMRPATDFERLVLRRLARRLAMTPDALIADIEARSVTSAALLPSSAAATADNHPNHRLLRRYVVLLCLLRDVASAFVYLSALPQEARLAGAAVPPGTVQSVVHRDVKPTNILLSAQGTALLADFGVAKVLALVTPQQQQQQPASLLQPAASEPTPLQQQQQPQRAPLAAAPSAPLPAHEQARLAGEAAPDSMMDMFNSWTSENGGLDPLASWGMVPEPALKRARALSTGALNLSLPAAAPAAAGNVSAGFVMPPPAAPVGTAPRPSMFPPHNPHAPPTFDLLPSIDIDMSWLSGLLDDEGAPNPGTAADAAAVNHSMHSGTARAAASGSFNVSMESIETAGSTAMLRRGSTGISSANVSFSAQLPGSSPNLAATQAAVPQWQVVEGGVGVDSWPSHRGTAHYAAPEDLVDAGYPLTPAADVFSLGYVMWEALGGMRPWLGACSADVVARAAQGARLPLPEAWPRRIRSLISWCWSANPAQRPSPVQVVAELDAEIRTALSRR